MSDVEPLRPMYDFSKAPAPVTLHSGTARLDWDGGSTAGTAEVQLYFMPIPRIRVAAVFRPSPMGPSPLELFVATDGACSFYLDEQKIEGWAIESRCSSSPSDEVLELSWAARYEPLRLADANYASPVAAIAFHLFNFVDFKGRGAVGTDAPSGRDQLVLKDDAWRATIQSLGGAETANAWKRIKGEGGAFLTHVGRLERSSGGAFSAGDASEQRDLLTTFLSFVNGSKCRPACEVGLGANAERLWETWRSPGVGGSAGSWFNPMQLAQAEALFPLFARRWNQSKEWKECLRTVIYWYLQANTDGRATGIDAAIILAQTAMERLSHHHLVVDRKMISLRGFDDLKASDRLRLLFSSLGIPNQITAATPDLCEAAKRFKWIDAPQALTDIRNELVHPVSRRQVGGCMVDGWKLSLWYVELSILALCGYGGAYTNRLTAKYVTQSENVPWTRMT